MVRFGLDDPGVIETVQANVDGAGMLVRAGRTHPATA